MRRLLAAIAFLTVVPVPSRWVREEDIAGSVPFFPFVGLLIGLVCAALMMPLLILLPHLRVPLAAVAALLLAGASGALHLDGLADSADGLCSHRERERMLEIMRDSRIGTMGVLAVVFVLLLKVLTLAALPTRVVGMPLPGMVYALCLLPICGRCAVSVVVALLPYARPTGLASAIYRHRSPLDAVTAALFSFLCGWLLLGAAGLVGASAALGATLLFALFCHVRLGGATGDTLGATCELAETAALLGLAAALPLLAG